MQSKPQFAFQSGDGRKKNSLTSRPIAQRMQCANIQWYHDIPYRSIRMAKVASKSVRYFPVHLHIPRITLLLFPPEVMRHGVAALALQIIGTG